MGNNKLSSFNSAGCVNVIWFQFFDKSLFDNNCFISREISILLKINKHIVFLLFMLSSTQIECKRIYDPKKFAVITSVNFN